MVSKAREDFPEPEMPVSTTRRSRGSSTEMFLRLCSRAPRMTMRSNGMALSSPEAHSPDSRTAAPSPAAAHAPSPREEGLAQSLPQFGDLVAQDGGLLEIQVSGGFAHLAFQRRDRLLQFLRGEHQQPGDIPGDFRPLLVGQRDEFLSGEDLPLGRAAVDLSGRLLEVEQVADRLADRHGGNTVLFVVSHLNLAPAAGFVHREPHPVVALILATQHGAATLPGPGHPSLQLGALRPTVSL